MKKRKLCLLALSLFMIGCDQVSSSSQTITTSQDDTNKLECEKGQFIFDEEEKYVASSFNSLYLLKDEFTKGQFKTSIDIKDKFSENGLVLNYSENSYYFVGFDLSGNILVYRKNNNDLKILFNKTLDFDVFDNTVDVSILKNEDNYEVYINDKNVFNFKNELDVSNKLGLYAGGKGTTYSNLAFNQDYNYDYDSEVYDFPKGTFEFEENKIVSSSTNAIVVSNAKTFSEGSLEVTMALKQSKTDNGIVFALSDNGKTEYWEEGVSYYFFFVNKDGTAFLGKVDNGKWSALTYISIKNYNNSGTYKLKVTKHNSDIYCFINDSLYFSYKDSNPLTGNKYGLRAGGNNVTYTSINLVSANNQEQEDNLNVGNGSFEQFDNIITSTSKYSLAVLKDKKVKDGTITASLIPGTSNDNGIIFRATRPTNSSFYEKEEGLSYYWFYYTTTGCVSFSKFENGVETKLQNKFLPWGSLQNVCYDVKIVLDGSDIYCYFGGRLSFYYHDDNPLQGEEFGVKAIGKNCTILNFNVDSNHQKETNEYLIFGHSYTEYWYTYKEDFPNYKDINDIGIGASNTGHWANQYSKEVIAYEPHYGIYWNGINDVTGGVDVNTTAGNVRKLLLEIKQSLPEFEVALVGVNRCPVASNKRDTIAQLNNLYKQIANENDFVHYVETEYMYCDSNGNELSKYFTDGLHPNHDGYKLASQAIITALGD